LKGVVHSRAEVSGYLRSPGDAVLVERGVPRWLMIACPCGCGAELPINLDARAGKAWKLYRNARRGLSLYPSVWRDTDCGSHFIIWRDNILLFGHRDEEFDPGISDEETSQLATTLLEHLPSQGFVAAFELADKLGQVPWDVLDALRHLAKRGMAREGVGKERGTFAKASADSKPNRQVDWWA
jgi:Family of unknown function (DUF6527)